MFLLILCYLYFLLICIVFFRISLFVVCIIYMIILFMCNKKKEIRTEKTVCFVFIWCWLLYEWFCRVFAHLPIWICSNIWYLFGNGAVVCVCVYYPCRFAFCVDLLWLGKHDCCLVVLLVDKDKLMQSIVCDTFIECWNPSWFW